jgi:hypothetical protein
MNIALVILILFAILNLNRQIGHYQRRIPKLALILSTVFEHHLLQQILATVIPKRTDMSGFIQIFIILFVLVD